MEMPLTPNIWTLDDTNYYLDMDNIPMNDKRKKNGIAVHFSSASSFKTPLKIVVT